MKQCFAPLLEPLGAIWLLMVLSVVVLPGELSARPPTMSMQQFSLLPSPTPAG